MQPVSNEAVNSTLGAISLAGENLVAFLAIADDDSRLLAQRHVRIIQLIAIDDLAPKTVLQHTQTSDVEGNPTTEAKVETPFRETVRPTHSATRPAECAGEQQICIKSLDWGGGVGLNRVPNSRGFDFVHGNSGVALNEVLNSKTRRRLYGTEPSLRPWSNPSNKSTFPHTLSTGPHNGNFKDWGSESSPTLAP